MASPEPREPLVRTSVMIFERQKEWLKKEAGEDDRSQSSLVRLALDKYADYVAAEAVESEAEATERVA